MSDAARLFDRVRRTIAISAEAAKAIAEIADQVQPAVDLYKRAHGGRPPRHIRAVDVPGPEDGPLIELGPLISIAYTKNIGNGPEDFVHDFKAPYAALCFRPESRDLVIVRDRSSYTVNNKGWIVG